MSLALLDRVAQAGAFCLEVLGGHKWVLRDMFDIVNIPRSAFPLPQV
jgi:hypothetical protein